MQTTSSALSRFAGGDHGAFAELVHQYEALVHSACRRILGPGPDVEDAVQATFIVLAREASRLRDAQNLSSWLYQVATHAARDLERERRARHRRERVVAAQLPIISNDRQADARDQLQEGLARLPASEREAIILVHLQGHTLASAGQQLGRPPGTIGFWLARGRQRLREHLRRADSPPVLVALFGRLDPSVAAGATGSATAHPMLLGTAPHAMLSASSPSACTPVRPPTVPGLNSAPPLTRAVRLADRCCRRLARTRLLHRVLLAGIMLALVGLGFRTLSAGQEPPRAVGPRAALALAEAPAVPSPVVAAGGNESLDILPCGMAMIVTCTMPVPVTGRISRPTAVERETSVPFLPPLLLQRTQRMVLGFRATDVPSGGIILAGDGLWDQAMHDLIRARCVAGRWGCQDASCAGHAALALTPWGGELSENLLFGDGRPTLQLSYHASPKGRPSHLVLMVMGLDAGHLAIGTVDFIMQLHPSPAVMRQDAMRSLLALTASTSSLRIALSGALLPGFSPAGVHGLAAWFDPSTAGCALHLRAPCADAATAAALQRQFAPALPAWSQLLEGSLPPDERATTGPFLEAFGRAQLRADAAVLSTDLSATTDYSQLMANFLKCPG